MYNWMLIETATGKIINALATPNEGVKPVATEGQEVLPITDSDFQGILDGNLKYYNAATVKLEPEIIRKLALLTPGPYIVGTVNLQFQQQDLFGTPVTEPVTFTVEVNGQSQLITVTDGILEVQLTCPDLVTVNLKITANRYETFETQIEVVAQ